MTETHRKRVWFITGAGRGFGLLFTQTALACGDMVVGTVRQPGQMSSVAGLTGLPTQGLYAASKFAVEGMSESLAHELASFGVTVTLVEPGAHATGFSLRSAEFTDAYQPVRAAL